MSSLNASTAQLPSVGGSGNIPDQVAEVLERAIIDGVLAPGERLNADELAQHFGVSRIPIREAFRGLSASGWVHIEPRHGAYVKKRSRVELHDLFETRLFLEGHAAGLAAQRRTTEHLATLERLVAEGRAAAKAGDGPRTNRINTEFHEALVQCTGNGVLTSMLKSLSERISWYYSTVTDQRGAHSMDEHAELLEAIKDQKADVAGCLVRQHIEKTRKAVERVIEIDN